MGPPFENTHTDKFETTHTDTTPPTPLRHLSRTESSESTLILRAQDGDILSFAVLLESYEPLISALSLQILHHEAEAELLVEETFLTAWRRLDSLHSIQDFRAWIFRMAAHHGLFVLRNRHHIPSGSARSGRHMVDAIPTTPVGGDIADPETTEELARIRAVDSVLITLPIEEHLAWLLHEVDGQSSTEIAEILEVAPERVRERIRRAQRAIVTGTEG